MPSSSSLSTTEQGPERLKEDFHVQPDGLLFDVLDVVVDPFLEVGFTAIAAAADLPEAGDAGADAEARLAPGGAHLVFLFGAGARADDGHLAHQDVEELRPLVD